MTTRAQRAASDATKEADKQFLATPTAVQTSEGTGEAMVPVAEIKQAPQPPLQVEDDGVQEVFVLSWDKSYLNNQQVDFSPRPVSADSAFDSVTGIQAPVEFEIPEDEDDDTEGEGTSPDPKDSSAQGSAGSSASPTPTDQEPF